MQKYKNLNNLSEEVIAQIPQLKPGEEKVFQMLNGHPNNDPDLASRQKNPVLYGKTQLMTNFRIRDPKTGLQRVGIPIGFDNDGNAVSFKPFLAGMFGDDASGQFLGKFSLLGGKVDDEELFEIFWLSPEREGSPFADRTIKPLFRIVDPAAEVKSTLTKTDTLREALNTLHVLGDDDVMKIARAKNWDGDPAAMRVKVVEFAKNSPDDFLKIKKDPDTEKKANIKLALDRNILTYDHASRKVLLDKTELLTVSQENTGDILSAIVGWINSAKNGTSVYDGILTQLKEPKK